MRIQHSMTTTVDARAFNLLLEHAAQLGANAVIGIQYDATEVICYGTAVVAEPLTSR